LLFRLSLPPLISITTNNHYTSTATSSVLGSATANGNFNMILWGSIKISEITCFIYSENLQSSTKNNVQMEMKVEKLVSNRFIFDSNFQPNLFPTILVMFFKVWYVRIYFQFPTKFISYDLVFSTCDPVFSGFLIPITSI
jgi:hypothetical protein